MPSTTAKRCAIGLCAGFLSASAAYADTCTPDRVSVKGNFGSITFRVEIADDAQERALGLMNRESLAKLSGMLFVYDKPQPLSFWMRNTLIPLDIIFVDQAGKIAKIHADAIPLDESPLYGGPELTHVLEINGGLAKEFGISEGDILRHSTFNQNEAHWPCG